MADPWFLQNGQLKVKHFQTHLLKELLIALHIFQVDLGDQKYIKVWND